MCIESVGQIVHKKGDRKLMNTGRETGNQKFYSMAGRKGIPVFVVEWGNRNICRELLTGFFLNIIWLMLIFLIAILLCLETLKNRKNELLYFSDFLYKIHQALPIHNTTVKTKNDWKKNSEKFIGQVGAGNCAILQVHTQFKTLYPECIKVCMAGLVLLCYGLLNLET